MVVRLGLFKTLSETPNTDFVVTRLMYYKLVLFSVVPNWGNMPANTQKVNESTPVTTTIFTVQATDYEGETITYHMTCNPSSGAITYFIMDVTSKF